MRLAGWFRFNVHEMKTLEERRSVNIGNYISRCSIYLATCSNITVFFVKDWEQGGQSLFQSQDV